MRGYIEHLDGATVVAEDCITRRPVVRHFYKGLSVKTKKINLISRLRSH